ALQNLVDQVDPAARGVHLLGPQLVRRAGRQAEPAVHAVLDHATQAFGLVHQLPSSRPGNIRWPGSNWSLTARIRAAPGTGPYAPAAVITAGGAASTATDPRRQGRNHPARRKDPAGRAAPARTGRRPPRPRPGPGRRTARPPRPGR